MDKKSFVRGFGIGVIFAVAILGVSCLLRTSDTETISRAKKLGMVFKSEEKKVVFSSNASESAINADDNKQETKAPDNTKVPNATAPPSTKTPVADKTTSNKKDENDVDKDDKSGTKDINDKKFNEEKKKMEEEINSKKKTLVIKGGDWSGDISNELEKMGIIDSAEEFDRYLTENGYGNTIKSGTYEVSPDDTFNEIAERITSKKK